MAKKTSDVANMREWLVGYFEDKASFREMKEREEDPCSAGKNGSYAAQTSGGSLLRAVV